MPHINAKDFKDSWAQSDWEYALRRLAFIKRIEILYADARPNNHCSELLARHAKEKAQIFTKYPQLAKKIKK